MVVRAPRPVQRFIDLPDGRMACLDFGPRDRAPDLVFVHANGFNASTYRNLLATPAKTHRILAVDLRGHGRTELPLPDGRLRSWRTHADDLIAFVEAACPRPPVLAGHSMGGTVSLLAASRRPDLARALVLLDPVIWTPRRDLLLSLPLFDRAAEKAPVVKGALKRRSVFASPGEALAAYRGRGAFKGWADQTLKDYLKDGLRLTDGGAYELACAPAWEAANFAAQGNRVWRALRRLQVPATVICGSVRSTTSRPDLVARSPGVKVEVLEGQGHFFPLLNPSETADRLGAALAG
ncbi:alpha/beta hydrolase [Brevundimonas sp. 2R-24]|uniref:Alpha/beta hydrolase n=1 Tax=Peiella sedimenti TaxID=3061083 RepID=A0ABT8SLK7_9CAUL|nr:alpha/beta hydrolase [Caulobacteraceae bacterium XZ-24]